MHLQTSLYSRFTLTYLILIIIPKGRYMIETLTCLNTWERNLNQPFEGDATQMWIMQEQKKPNSRQQLSISIVRSRENETPGEHPEWSRISTVVREATGKGSGARLFVVKSLDFSLQIEEYCSWIRGSCDWDQKGQSKKNEKKSKSNSDLD